MASLYRKESQLGMLEAGKRMAAQGIEPETGDEPFDEEPEDELVDEGTFEDAEGLDEDEDEVEDEGMSSGDERQAPEPVLMGYSSLLCHSLLWRMWRLR